MFFQTFWPEIGLSSLNHTLPFTNIYNFLNSNCLNALDSKNCKLIKIANWVFVYELSGSGFESSCSHLKFTLTFFTNCRDILNSKNIKIYNFLKLNRLDDPHSKNIKNSKSKLYQLFKNNFSVTLSQFCAITN